MDTTKATAERTRAVLERYPDAKAWPATPGEQVAALRQRHRIEPVQIQPAHLIGLPVAGVLSHHVCNHDGIPVYEVGGGQWRHDGAAIRHLAHGTPPGPARMSL